MFISSTAILLHVPVSQTIVWAVRNWPWAPWPCCRLTAEAGKLEHIASADQTSKKRHQLWHDEYPQKFVLDSRSENKPRRCMLRYLRSPRINLQQYHVSVFFQFFTMSKMVISSMYIFWKNSLLPRLHKKIDFVYYNNIILYIYDNTHILPIPPNTYEYHQYHTKKTSGTELISTLGSLHIGLFFLLHTSRFQPMIQGGIVYRKKLSCMKELSVVALPSVFSIYLVCDAAVRFSHSSIYCNLTILPCLTFEKEMTKSRLVQIKILTLMVLNHIRKDTEVGETTHKCWLIINYHEGNGPCENFSSSSWQQLSHVAGWKLFITWKLKSWLIKSLPKLIKIRKKA
jgi:hypothetical protein